MNRRNSDPYLIIPAQAGIQGSEFRRLPWTPAFAGVTNKLLIHRASFRVRLQSVPVRTNRWPDFGEASMAPKAAALANRSCNTVKGSASLCAALAVGDRDRGRGGESGREAPPKSRRSTSSPPPRSPSARHCLPIPAMSPVAVDWREEKAATSSPLWCQAHHRPRWWLCLDKRVFNVNHLPSHEARFGVPWPSHACHSKEEVPL